MMSEKNYDFRERHWQVHKPGRRDVSRKAGAGELMLDGSWRLGCGADAPALVRRAVADFQDYLSVSMGLSLCLVSEPGERTLFLQTDARERGFTLEVQEDRVVVTAAARDAFRATVYLEDVMNLELVPALPLGTAVRTPLYKQRNVHSGCGQDEFPDNELLAIVHAGYDAIVLFVSGFDQSSVGYCNINDVIQRAEKFGLETVLYDYIRCYHHPDEEGAQKYFDDLYGELFRRYPGAQAISLCGESLEFPSRDPHTSGKCYRESVVDGIPETRPSPGWYPCSDYPAYLACIEKAVHKAKPSAQVIFSTYNWGYAPLELRRGFLRNFPKNMTLNVCYEIFSRRTLEGLQTPVMDYTISATEPGYYFQTETAAAHEFGIPVQGNVNTAGICWDFGCVPYVPVPARWLARNLRLREARKNGVESHYATHHYGWWQCVAADIGRWASWEEYQPDYGELLRKIAIRDYGREHADAALKAWELWGKAMDFYIASNEDQYGPWRVGAAYPFIFQPNITRTMTGKEIQFPTAPQAHNGYHIVKTLYQPYENECQSPGFLRYPAELRSLEKMLALWDEGLEQVRPWKDSSPEAARLEALAHFIRNSIRTVRNIKRWWLLNMSLQTSPDAKTALGTLDKIEALAREEIENARDTIPAVRTDSRLGWEPSMEYVCDQWHLEWKVRQVESALREIETYRGILKF